MKKLIVFPIIFCLCVTAFAQTISFRYDAAGNRTHRNIIPMPMQARAATMQAEEESFAKYITPQNEQLGEVSIIIYPNPTRGLLRVVFDNLPDNEAVNLQVFDMRGRFLLQQTSYGSTEIDLSAKPAGSYILVITHGNNRTSWQIIKQ